MIRQYNSIVEPLLERVKCEPEAQAMVLFGDDGTETEVTVGHLHREVTAYARSLQALGLGPGDIVTIALPHSIGLIAAFWGAMYIGIIPTIFPYLVPRPDADTFKKQVRTLTENAGAKAIITDSKEEELSTLLADLDCQVLHTRQIKCEDDDSVNPLPNNYTTNEQIAFLQYTSGTTGLRKGVRLSHRALLNFIPAFVEALAINKSDVVVNWLPLYHEYGLFAGVVLPMFVGIPTVLMSPFKWVRSPKTWLQAVHTYRGTLCWTTNSAYHHLSRAVRDRDLAGIDLSSLRALVSGAEPVLHQSHQMFLKRFADYGISEATLLSGYGVAENTMAVTVNPPGSPFRLNGLTCMSYK